MDNNEINKLIHERILGKCLVLQFAESGIVSTSENCKQCGKSLIASHYVKIPDYCNLINKAWEVVEQLKLSEIFVSISTENNEVYFWTIDDYYELGRTRKPFTIIKDNNIAKAICLAAIATIK